MATIQNFVSSILKSNSPLGRSADSKAFSQEEWMHYLLQENIETLEKVQKEINSRENINLSNKLEIFLIIRFLISVNKLHNAKMDGINFNSNQERLIQTVLTLYKDKLFYIYCDSLTRNNSIDKLIQFREFFLLYSAFKDISFLTEEEIKRIHYIRTITKVALERQASLVIEIPSAEGGNQLTPELIDNLEKFFHIYAKIMKVSDTIYILSGAELTKIRFVLNKNYRFKTKVSEDKVQYYIIGAKIGVAGICNGVFDIPFYLEDNAGQPLIFQRTRMVLKFFDLDDFSKKHYPTFSISEREFVINQLKKNIAQEHQLLSTLPWMNVPPLIIRDHSMAIIMAKLGDKDLHEILVNEPLNIEQRIYLAISVVKAVQVIHAKDLIHRDLKPGNIRIRTDLTQPPFYEAYVIDLGFAIQDTLSQEAHGVAGTRRYMRPEHIEMREARKEQSPEVAYGKKDDIFSLCIVLEQILFLPFLKEGREYFENMSIKYDKKALLYPLISLLQDVHYKCISLENIVYRLESILLSKESNRFLFIINFLDSPESFTEQEIKRTIAFLALTLKKENEDIAKLHYYLDILKKIYLKQEHKKILKIIEFILYIKEDILYSEGIQSDLLKLNQIRSLFYDKDFMALYCQALIECISWNRNERLETIKSLKQDFLQLDALDAALFSVPTPSPAAFFKEPTQDGKNPDRFIHTLEEKNAILEIIDNSATTLEEREKKPLSIFERLSTFVK